MGSGEEVTEHEPDEMKPWPAHLAESPEIAARHYERYGLTTVISGDDTARLERAALAAPVQPDTLPAYDRLWADLLREDGPLYGEG